MFQSAQQNIGRVDIAILITCISKLTGIVGETDFKLVGNAKYNTKKGQMHKSANVLNSFQNCQRQIFKFCEVSKLIYLMMITESI